MTLQQLRYLLGIVDNGLNITAAAETLHTSQPGISRQLKQLEREIGITIFSRKGKSLVSLTPAGRNIVKLARRIVQDVDNIRSLGQDMAAEEEGSLSIGTTPTQARYVLPEILSQFHERYPRVNIELHQGTSEQIAALVAENRIDFAIATDSRELFPELNLLPCFHWDRIVLTTHNHPLSQQSVSLTLEALSKFPLVTYVFSTVKESSFLRSFSAENIEPNVVLTARDADVIKTHVRMGMGVGIIAPMALQCEELDQLVAIDAEGLFPTVTTWLGFPRDKVLRQYMKDFVGMFAPHWPSELIELACSAETQIIVDKLAASLSLPTRTGCTKVAT